MGSAPSRIVGVIWIDDVHSSFVTSSRFSLPTQATPRFRHPASCESIVPADLQRLESDLQAAFELAMSR
jgi:hypothetical protein